MNRTFDLDFKLKVIDESNKEVVKDSVLKDQPFRYASYFYDTESSQYYLMARYYHPKHGVFLAVDPELGADETAEMHNVYSYAKNNSVLYTDVDGNRSGRAQAIRKALTKLINLAKKTFTKEGKNAAKKLKSKPSNQQIKNLNKLRKKKSLNKGSTGRVTPKNLQEKLFMEEVLSESLAYSAYVRLRKGMTDKRWHKKDGWVKMTRVHIGNPATKKDNIEIHFVYNRITYKFDDFKFVNK
ncbi:RHS repeat-associated core domain-containing protein [Macrococcus equipercicus]|uniref:RHS repeat-associated core domain-containing protein n=1 Tax=Macrococcus equipercicus TaxID=69967 RepID=A0ABQ6R6T7_9STAP|nr:RHS repeat-associated core domain-containing protein [Macrococcus equipercicus]KAA1036991.1 RHS repeat-associated core domain-containing protein [Macrococcus equipercicus]